MQSIVVNGVLAFINGTNFEAVNVPLNDGANLITATLFDSTMLTNVSSINITTTSNSDGSLNSPVQLRATTRLPALIPPHSGLSTSNQHPRRHPGGL